MAKRNQRKEMIITLKIVEETSFGNTDLIKVMCEDSFETRVKDPTFAFDKTSMIDRSEDIIKQIARCDLGVVGVLNYAIIWGYAKYRDWVTLDDRATAAIFRLR